MSTEDHKLRPTAPVTTAAERRLTEMISIVNRKANEAETHAQNVDARLNTIEGMDLPGKVVEMSRILSGLAHKEGTAAKLWNWPAMNAEQTYAALNHLVHWRETVWRRYFPNDYAEYMEPCWLQHPDVLHLLGALCGMWHWANTEADSSPLRQAEWLARWKPLLLKEVKDALEACKSEQRHVDRREPARPIDLEAEQEQINQHTLAMQQREDAAKAATS